MKTPQLTYPALAEAFGIPELYFKREGMHKYGSHKGRSIPGMIKYYVKKEAVRAFAISSSGNAALAAIKATSQHNKNNPDKQITLQIFVGLKINEKKEAILREAIDDEKITIEKVERPKQTVFGLDKDGTAKSLRQSTDDLALEGYFPLANELNKIPDLAAVFIPASSGTTAQAIAEAFASEDLDQNPEIHIVQTTSCHPIADALGAECEGTDMSIAGAIVDHVAHRKDRVVELVKNSKGQGWIVLNTEIKSIQELVEKKTRLGISTNGALAVAALKKAVESGWRPDGAVVCLIGGR